MTDSVTPGDGIHDIDPYLTAGAIRYGGGDWIVPDTETYYAAHEGLSGLPLDEFEAKHSAGSFDVTIGTGEAFVAGSWLGRDTQTTVTLDSQTNGQTVYLGWKKGTSNAVVVGTSSAFSSGWPRVAIWEFDTDGSGVMAARDSRPLGEQIDVRNEGSAADADTVGGVGPGKFVRGDNTQSAQENVATNDFRVLHPTSAGVVSLRSVRNDHVYLGSSTEPVRLRGPVRSERHPIKNLPLLSTDVLEHTGSSSINVNSSLNFSDTQRLYDLPDPNDKKQPTTRGWTEQRYINTSSEGVLNVDKVDGAHADTLQLSGSRTIELQSIPNGNQVSVMLVVPDNRRCYITHVSKRKRNGSATDALLRLEEVNTGDRIFNYRGGGAGPEYKPPSYPVHEIGPGEYRFYIGNDTGSTITEGAQMDFAMGASYQRDPTGGGN